MPFTLIQGTFHLVGRTRAGKDSGFEPDGDSMQFKPDNAKLLDRLQKNGSAYRLTSIGSTQLRFEGIDALELHFEGSHQPRPLADNARDFLTGRLGLNPVPYKPPEDLSVLPPVERDGTPGFILSRALEAHGRPVAFVFDRDPPQPDGAEIVLKPALLRKSVNFKSMAAGHAYPLYYDTLFVDLRDAFTAATATAREKKLGIWADDRSVSGIAIGDQATLERDAVVFPKLFRRLTEYLKEHPGDAAGFVTWLADKREQVLDLTTHNFTHFDNVVEEKGGAVRLLRRPQELVFVSAKTSSRAVAPWLKV
jgi:endonuclease YncB( thermonuclease family)